MKQILTTIVVLIVVLGLGVFGYQYVSDQQTYISTDNATVQADLNTVSATQTGKLSDWTIKEGDQVNQGDVVGKITNQSLSAKATGTVVRTSVYPKQNVFAGQTLAQVADLTDTYVLAYIDEDQVDAVKQGKDVKVTIESLSSETYDGKVEEIGSGTGAYFSSSQSSTTGKSSSEKQVQRIPVKISVNNLPISRITIGVHAEVKIER